MKIKYFKFFIISFGLFTSSCDNFSKTSNVESKQPILETVKIGSQLWTSENLNVSTFRNGDPIPEIEDKDEWEKAGNEGRPAWCYYDNNIANKEIFGKLYNWYAIHDPRQITPEGYHIADDEEWKVLIKSLSNDGPPGYKMKSNTGWENTSFKSGKGNNQSGFSGLPGGIRLSKGEFVSVGSHGYWWSSSTAKTDKYAWYSCLYSVAENVPFSFCEKSYGLSVRCIKD